MVALVVDAVVRAGIADAALIAPWVLLALWAVYVTMYASHIVTDADGITVQNFLRRTVADWAAVTDVIQRYQLIITLDGDTTLTAYGAPASGNPVRAARRASAGREDAGARVVDEIRDTWERHATEGPRRIRRSWDLPALGALGALVLWAVIACVIAWA